MIIEFKQALRKIPRRNKVALVLLLIGMATALTAASAGDYKTSTIGAMLCVIAGMLAE